VLVVNSFHDRPFFEPHDRKIVSNNHLKLAIWRYDSDCRKIQGDLFLTKIENN
jgi:hypothetical protein